jgi:hypothetical protein
MITSQALLEEFLGLPERLVRMLLEVTRPSTQYYYIITNHKNKK